MWKPERKPKDRVASWLLLVCAMIYIMVLLGGLTRLTEAGLSIVRWDVVQGSLPPLSHAKWLSEFEAYKLSPQYQKVNQGMTLEDFKFIYFMEWFHRFWGRLIGLVVFFPLLYFWLKGHLDGLWKRRLLLLFFLGGMQGVVGWFMVKSGLVNEPRVSHYRLTLHLYLALLVMGLSLWFALERLAGGSGKWLLSAKAALALLVLQIGSGAFVAGLRAGYAFNTWPRMNGHWIPPGVWSVEPWYRNFLENPVMIQWSHRYLAYLAAGAIAFFAIGQLRRLDLRAGSKPLLFLVLVLLAGQILLGIATLVMRMPIALASAHQATAFALFAALLAAIYLTSVSPSAGSESSPAQAAG